jgi:DNA-directed RNA polymerase subunit RPC12/RpoP
VFQYQCPRCKTRMESPFDQGGSKRNCPACGQRLQIPSPPNKTILADLVDDGPTSPPHSEPAKWIVAGGGVRGGIKGAVSWDELHRMAQDGRLHRNDLVKEDGDSGWRGADTIPGLWPEEKLEEVADEPPVAAMRNPYLIPCQSCGRPIAKAAPACPICGAENHWMHPEIARFLSKKRQFQNIPDLELKAQGFVLTGRSRLPATFAGNLADILGNMRFFGSRSGVVFSVLEARWLAQELREIAGPEQQTFLVDFHTDPPTWQSSDHYYWIKVMDFFGFRTDSVRKTKKTGSWPKLLFQLALNYIVYPFLVLAGVAGLLYIGYLLLIWSGIMR